MSRMTASNFCKGNRMFGPKNIHFKESIGLVSEPFMCTVKIMIIFLPFSPNISFGCPKRLIETFF